LKKILEKNFQENNFKKTFSEKNFKKIFSEKKILKTKIFSEKSSTHFNQSQHILPK